MLMYVYRVVNTLFHIFFILFKFLFDSQRCVNCHAQAQQVCPYAVARGWFPLWRKPISTATSLRCDCWMSSNSTPTPNALALKMISIVQWSRMRCVSCFYFKCLFVVGDCYVRGFVGMNFFSSLWFAYSQNGWVDLELVWLITIRLDWVSEWACCVWMGECVISNFKFSNRSILYFILHKYRWRRENTHFVWENNKERIAMIPRKYKWMIGCLIMLARWMNWMNEVGIFL